MFHTQPSSDITMRQLGRSLGLCVTPYPVEPYSCYLCDHTTYRKIKKKVVIKYDVKQVRISAGDGTNIKHILLL